MKKSSSTNFFSRLFIFLFLTCIFSSFILDPDFGWHLAIGQRLLSFDLVREDIFSWTMPGYLWGNSYVIYEFLLAGLFNLFGYKFLIFAFSALSSLSLLVLTKKVNFETSLLVILAGGLALSNVSVRPHVFSLLLFALLLLALERKLFERPIFSAVGFLTFAVWANLHRGFVFALGVLGLFVLLNFLRTKKVNKWTLVFISSCFLGTFVTPFPLLVWSGGIADDFKTWENLYYIAEWFPTAVFFPTNILFAISGAVFIYMFLFCAKKVEPVWFVLGSFIFAFAFIFVSLVTFWAAFFTFFVSRYFTFPISISKNINTGDRVVLGTVTSLCALSLCLLFALRVYEGRNLDTIVTKEGYPQGAVNYLKNEQISGNLFNEYKWGGYLIWQGNMPVFIDGRMAGWKRDGRSILGDYAAISAGDCTALSGYEVSVVLVGREFNDKCFVNFEKVYEDDVSKILLKTSGS